MKIEAVYIACYKYDLRFTRILVASIRYWYPEIPVFLIKDLFYGSFDTTEIEQHWKVGCLTTDRNCFGWGFAKLEPLFLPGSSRCLILDSDIAFIGPVLGLLESCSEDFVVQMENSAPDFVESHYFNLAGLGQMDPAFAFPGFTFNTGQMVATTGILKREDFAPFVSWQSSPPKVLHPQVFKLGEQGLVNYILMKKQAESRISLGNLRFMNVPGCEDCPRVEIKELVGKSSPPALFHWCGRKKPQIAAMEQGAILEYFEEKYYQPIPMGNVKKWSRIAVSGGEELLRASARSMGLQRLRAFLKAPKTTTEQKGGLL